MDSQRAVFDSVKTEKANAMRRYRWRQNLRWFLKACLPLAPLSYVLCLEAPRQVLIAVFSSNLCVFLLFNALLVVTCVLSGESLSGSDNSGGDAEPDIYDEYVANVDFTRRSGGLTTGLKELAGPEGEEDLVNGKEVGCVVPSRSMFLGYESMAERDTTTLPADISNFRRTESDENVNVEFLLPVCEDKAVTESKIVVSPVSAVTTKTSGRGKESEKVKSYRRTHSESFKKERREPKRGLQRSVTEKHRKNEPDRRCSVEELSDEEFQRQVELFINSNKRIQMLENR
ncbi:uncharacterized protein LOC126784956 [Argentina anserina]|uniref:uncharacterized protein LOC126784956 n=1 Tax=Argentina anserina TaxID=57926 RepID=UPI0021769260|nr:uncharacterized protein LOC126784956 [Potentilla anserina]